jgi:hypothetical protein
VLIDAAFCLLNYYVALKAKARNMEVESGDWGCGLESEKESQKSAMGPL